MHWTEAEILALIGGVAVNFAICRDIYVRYSTERFATLERRDKIDAEEKAAKDAETAKKTESVEEINNTLVFQSRDLPEFLMNQLKHASEENSRLALELEKEKKKHDCGE